MSKQVTRIGIDLAKTVFQVCQTSSSGQVISNRKIHRQKLTQNIAQTASCEIIMEACSSAHYWAQVFTQYGHQVKLIHPAYVRPFIKTNKNDAADAEALCEAAARPTMRFVQPKTQAQQDTQLMHRVRERSVIQRTSLANHIRGLLAEYGVIVPQGIKPLRRALPDLLEDANNALTAKARVLFADLYQELCEICERVKRQTQLIEQACAEDEQAKRLTSVPGVGPIVATALACKMGSAQSYRNGRELSAFLGLVPKQHSSGGKNQLLGISKRGDPYVRKLMVQGAMSVLCHLGEKQDRFSCWCRQIKARKGTQVAALAVANKMARICWAVSAQQSRYHALAPS